MNKPVHQHFIPRSYLNNFSEEKSGTKIIHGRRLQNEIIIPLSTKDICVNKNLYTIPTDDESKKFALEHFYANNVDNKFSEIYKILKNKNITTIDFETRLKIINTALSLFFRTPKFLNQQNKLIETVINEIAKNSKEESITITFLNEKITIEKEKAQELIKEKKENNRIKFLHEHLLNYEKFVQSKLHDNICVYHIVDESEFITCDNPVVIRPYADPTSTDFDHHAYLSQDINPFESSNMIQLPIDNKSILIILPSRETQIENYIQHLDIGKVDVLMYNSETQKFSESWILGSEQGIKNHDSDQIKYNEINPENKKMVEEYIDKTLEIKNLVELMKKHGSKSEVVKGKMNELLAKPHIASDLNFQKISKLIGN